MLTTEAATGGVQTCNFIDKETLAQVFSCEFFKISKNTFFIGHLKATASVTTNSKAIMKVNSKDKLNSSYNCILLDNIQERIYKRNIELSKRFP